MIKAVPLRLSGLARRSAVQRDALGGAIASAAAGDEPSPELEGSDREAGPLSGRRLLIAEDEFLIAQDLLQDAQQEGMVVLGPYSSVDAALAVLDGADPVDAAILDLNLRGRITFDLADRLVERAVPFVFYTGYDSVIVPDKFRMVRRLQKPAGWKEIRRALFSGRDAKAQQRLVKRLSADAPDLSSMLPTLQRRARQITPNPELAERLIERTLERAIREIDACPAGMPMEHWLIGLLESTGIGDARHLN